MCILNFKYILKISIQLHSKNFKLLDIININRIYFIIVLIELKIFSVNWIKKCKK